jgi:hypothetical protein
LEFEGGGPVSDDNDERREEESEVSTIIDWLFFSLCETECLYFIPSGDFLSPCGRRDIYFTDVDFFYKQKIKSDIYIPGKI